jgi:hypothetical protein
MKIIICGGRDYDEAEYAFKMLDLLFDSELPELVIEGGARGADRIGRHWADTRGIPVLTMNAQWDLYGKSAGYRRNTDMADEGPDLVVALPGGRGTQHMIDIANKRKITVLQIPKSSEA